MIRNIAISRNLLTLFIVAKISGIFLIKFEKDYGIFKRERDIFQNKKCYIGVISNILFTSFFGYIIIRGILADKISIGDITFIGMFVVYTLLLLNSYISNDLTVSCLNEGYKLLKICKTGAPISAKSVFFVSLPCLVQILIPMIHHQTLPMDLHTFIGIVGMCLQNFIAIPTVLIIVLVIRISEITCDKVISDLIALGCMSPNTCYFKLRRVLVLYIRLADFIESISPAFSFKILAIVGDYFFSSYFTLVFAMFASQKYYGPMTIETFIELSSPIISIQLRMIVLCSLGNQMQQKASKIEKHVDDLLVRAVLKDQYLLKTKLAAFKLEIQNRKYKISPYGFFSLNMELYTSILTVLASNCAMILQVFSSG